MKPQEYKPVNFGMLKSDSERDWITAIRTEIRNAKKVHSQIEKKHGSEVEILSEWDSILEKRRERALRASLPKISEKHPNLVYTWITLNIASRSYAEIEKRHNLLLAAAIWILDQIDSSDLPNEELYKLLPTDDKDFDISAFPDVWDCHFDNSLIISVEYVLRNRNRDVAPLESNGMDGIRVWTSTIAAKGLVHSDSKSRQNYERLIGLIPQEKIDAAVRNFEHIFNLWKDRFFACAEILYEEKESARKQVNEIREMINESDSKLADYIRIIDNKNDSYDKQRKNQLKFPFANSEVGSPISQDFGSNYNGTLSDPFVDNAMKLDLRLSNLDFMEEEACKRFDKALENECTFCSVLSGHGYIPKEQCEKLYGSVVSSKMEVLPISNPYELCFALLYLLEQGSDIPWLYGACTGMMAEVANCLPWRQSFYDEKENNYLYDTSEDNMEIDLPDWYERKYYRKNIEEEFNSPYNLAQLVYEETGCLLPRNIHKYENKYKLLCKYGINNNDIVLLYCMNILEITKHKMDALNIGEAYKEIGPDGKPIENGNKLTQEELQKRISDQNDEIQQLKSALYTAERKVADAQKQLDDEKTEFEIERRELADLREYIFLRNQAEEQEEELSVSNEFPYDVKKSTVVFGGHPNWIKVFKPLFKGNIRYVEAGATFDSDIIKNCDVVWIQINVFSHSQFYKLINTVRQYHKPVRYFIYGSAMKCGKQLVDTDKEL